MPGRDLDMRVSHLETQTVLQDERIHRLQDDVRGVQSDVAELKRLQWKLAGAIAVLVFFASIAGSALAKVLIN